MLTGLTLVTDAAGAGSAPLPIPADPSYVGLNLFYQWVIVDAGGGILGAFSASDALQVVLGN